MTEKRESKGAGAEWNEDAQEELGDQVHEMSKTCNYHGDEKANKQYNCVTRSIYSMETIIIFCTCEVVMEGMGNRNNEIIE